MKLPFASWRTTVVMILFLLTITTKAVVHEHHIKVHFDDLRDLIVDGSNSQLQQTPTEKIETDFLVQKIGQLKSEKEQLQLSQSTMILSMKNLQKQYDRMQNDNLVLREIIQSQQEEKDTRMNGDGVFWWRITTLVLSMITLVQYMIGRSRIRTLNDVKHDKATLMTHNQTLETRINDLQDQLKISQVNLTKALKDRDTLLNETTILEDRLLELEDRIETDKTTLTKLKKEKEHMQSRLVTLEEQTKAQAQALVEAVIPFVQTDMVTTAEMISNENGPLSTNNHVCQSPPPPSHNTNPNALSPSSSSLVTHLVERRESDNNCDETLRSGLMTKKGNMLTSLYRTPNSRHSSVKGNHTSTSVFSSGHGSGAIALPRPRSRSKPNTANGVFSTRSICSRGTPSAFNSRGMLQSFHHASHGLFSPPLPPTGSLSPLRNPKLRRGNWPSTNSNSTPFSMTSMVDKPTTTEDLTTDQPVLSMEENHSSEKQRLNNVPVVVSPSTPTSIPSSSTSMPLHLSTPQRLVDTINSPSPSQYQYQFINDPSSNTVDDSQKSIHPHHSTPSRSSTARSHSNNHGFNSSPHQAVNDQQQHASPSKITSSVEIIRNKPRVRRLIAEIEQKRKKEEEWLETVSRQRNVLLGMSPGESDDVKRTDDNDNQTMNMTMSLLLAEDAESMHDGRIGASDGLLDTTTLNLGEVVNISQELRGGEDDSHSTVYGLSFNSPLGESIQRPSAVDMTTIYPIAVDQYHQPTVGSSITNGNNNNNNNNSTSDNVPGVDPSMTNLPIESIGADGLSRVVTVVAKEIRTSPISSSPARLIDRGQVRVQVYPPSTTPTTTISSNNNNNDDLTKIDEHTLRESVDVYQRQALRDQTTIQALKQERDALLSAASAMTQSLSDVQTRGAQMFSPSGTWTPNLNPRSHSTNTPMMTTTLWRDPLPNTTPSNNSTVTPYDGPPIKTIQKHLNPTTTSTIVASNQYVQRIQELEEKLRFESEQTAVILSQRDTFAMSKSTLTAKLAVLEEQVRKDKEMFVWLTEERDRLLDLNAEVDLPQDLEEEDGGLRLSADTAYEDMVDIATNGNSSVSTTALWSQLETMNAAKATQQRRLVELEGQIERDREIFSAQLSTLHVQLATMTKSKDESMKERNVAVSNLASIQKEMMTLKDDKAMLLEETKRMQLQQDTLHRELQERKTEIAQMTLQKQADEMERNQLRSSVDVLLGIKATSDQHLATMESQLASVCTQLDKEMTLRAKESMETAASTQTLTQQFTEKLAATSAEYTTALATKNNRIVELEKGLAEMRKDTIAMTEHMTVLASKDSRIVLLEEQLSITAVKCIDDVTAANAAAKQEASYALSKAQQVADAVIAQLQQDISVLQGCVDKKDIVLKVAQQEADSCILQMDDQLRLVRAEIAVLSASVDEKESIIYTLQLQIKAFEKETTHLSAELAEATTNYQNQSKELSSLEMQLHELAEAKITSDQLFDHLKAEALAVEIHVEQMMTAKDSKINALEMAVDVYTGSQLAIDQALFVADEQAQSHKRECLKACNELAEALAQLATSVSAEQHSHDMKEIQQRTKIQCDQMEIACTQKLAQMTSSHETQVVQLTKQLADMETTLLAMRNASAADQLLLANQATELTSLSSIRMRLTEKDNRISDLECQLVSMGTKDQLIVELQKQIDEKDELVRNMESLIQERDQLIIQTTNLKEELGGIQCSDLALEAHVDDLQFQVTELQMQIRVANDANRDLVSTLAETTSTHDAKFLLLTNQVSDLTNSKIALEDRMTKDRESLSALMIERDVSLAQSNQRVSELEGQLTSGRESLRQLEDKTARAREETISLRQELADLHLVNEEQTHAAAAASVLATTLANLEIQSLKRQLHDTENASTEANNRLQSLLEKSEGDFLALSVRYSELMTTSSSAQLASDQEKEALKEQLASLQSTSSATITEWESLCKRNAADITLSQQRVNELEGQLVENTTTHDAMVSLLVDHHDARVVQLTQQISDIQNELSIAMKNKTTLAIELSEQIITLQSDRDRQAQEWSSQRTTLENQANNLTKHLEEQTAIISDLRTELRLTHADCSDLTVQLDRLSQAKKQDNDQIHILQQSLAMVNEELVCARESTQTLQQTHLLFESESTQQIRELKASLSSSQLSQTESLDQITAMEASVISWKDQVEELNVLIANMKETSQAHADTLTLAISAAQQRFVDLETEHASTITALTSTHHKEMSQLTAQLLTVQTEGSERIAFLEQALNGWLEKNAVLQEKFATQDLSKEAHVDALEARVSELIGELAMSEKRVVELTRELEKMEDLTMEAEMESKVEGLESQLQELRQERQEQLQEQQQQLHHQQQQKVEQFQQQLQQTLSDSQSIMKQVTSRHQEIESQLHMEIESLRTTNATLLAQLQDLAEAKIIADQLFDEVKAEGLYLETQVEMLVAEKDEQIEELKQAVLTANNNHRTSQAAADDALLLLDEQLSRAKAEVLTLREDLVHAQSAANESMSEFNQAITGSNERLQALEKTHAHTIAEKDQLHELAIAALQVQVFEKDDNVRMLLCEHEQWQTQWQHQQQDMLMEATAREVEIEDLSEKCRCFVEHIALLEQQQQQQQHAVSPTPLIQPVFKSSSGHPPQSQHILHTQNPLHQSTSIPPQGMRLPSSAFSSSSTLFNLSQSSAISTPRSTPLESDNHSIATDNMSIVGLPLNMVVPLHTMGAPLNTARLFQPLSFAPKTTTLMHTQDALTSPTTITPTQLTTQVLSIGQHDNESNSQNDGTGVVAEEDEEDDEEEEEQDDDDDDEDEEDDDDEAHTSSHRHGNGGRNTVWRTTGTV